MACGDNAGSKDAKGDDSTSAMPTAVKLKEENVTYKDDTTNLNGFVAFDESFSTARPAVIIVPEWWGLNEYPKKRARELAEMGYV
ncbi:MAG: dienelactone hydrolase family protein, partial [Chitinophagaceae bacterium]